MAQHLLTKAVVGELADIAIQASRAVMEIYEQPALWNVGNKSDASPLTRADLVSNQIILRGLAKLAPNIPVLSEESLWTGGSAATYWAVDPLDGTKEFIKRNGEFTVNIALVIDGVSRLGLIAAPALNTFWAGLCPDSLAAWAGKYVWPVGNEVHSYSWEEMSRSHSGDDLPDWLMRIVGDPEVIEKGSSLKFCLIAQGDADLYVRMGPTSIWDTAAGQAIVKAAGGRVIDLEHQSELTYVDPRKTLNPSFMAYADGRIDFYGRAASV